MQTLDGAMQQLADAKQQMNCEGGNGKQGQGDAQEMLGGGQGDGKDGKPGMGLGKGRGDGARPNGKSNGSFFDSKVPQDVRRAAGQITGLTGGPNLKGQAKAEIQKTATEIEHGSTDPLSGQRLPKKQSEHAQQYFDSFREGK